MFTISSSLPGSAAKTHRQWIVWTVLASAGASLGFASPAAAETVIDTYTGNLMTTAQIARFYPGNTDTDDTGLFGTASATGADIVGQPFKVVVTTDIATAISSGQTVVTDPGTGDVDEVYAPAANTAAFTTVAITINGVTLGWSENQPGSEVAESGQFQESVVNLFNAGPGFVRTTDEFAMQVASYPLHAFDFPSNLAAPGTYSVQPPGGNIIDQFRISVTGVTPDIYTNGYFDPSALTVSVAGVPEPSTWGMMLVGFGALGVCLRGARRRRAIVVA
jgi:hypothetical protein